MALAGKRIVIVGMGQSGVAAARLCQVRDADVVAVDRRPASELDPAFAALGVPLVHQDEVDLRAADLVVVSPGVPSSEALDSAEAAGVEVIGELELAARFVRGPIALVGGTNGKSTTTTLLGAILGRHFQRVFTGGNLGVPLSAVVDEAFDVFVVEASSFQLERVPTLRPRVSVLLNISEDHLDRYTSFEAYAEAKGNAFVHQLVTDTAIIPAGDESCLAQARRGSGRRVTVGEDGGYRLEGRSLREVATDTRFDLTLAPLHGAHNLSNAAFAIAAARALGVSETAVDRGLRAFEPLAHRMALIGNHRGVRYYDDSKATNVGAAVTALSGLEEDRCVLIAGGRDKGGSYQALYAALERRARAVVLIGEAADRIELGVPATVPVLRAGSLEEAVRTARTYARTGDAVLLSPACSSFDMFQSYAHRGDVFARAVNLLAEEVCP